jgi:hypothetical protein
MQPIETHQDTGKNIKASGALAAKLLKEHKEKKIKLPRASVKMIKQAQTGGAPSDEEEKKLEELITLMEHHLDIRELIKAQIKNSGYQEFARVALVNKEFAKAYSTTVTNPINNITTARELIDYLSINRWAESLYNFEKSNTLTKLLNQKLDNIIEELLVFFPLVRNATVKAELRNMPDDDNILSSHMYNTQQYPDGHEYRHQPTGEFSNVHGFKTAYEAWEALWILRHIKYISLHINWYVDKPYARGYKAKTGLEPTIVPLISLNGLIENLRAIPPKVKVALL